MFKQGVLFFGRQSVSCSAQTDGAVGVRIWQVCGIPRFIQYRAKIYKHEKDVMWGSSGRVIGKQSVSSPHHTTPPQHNTTPHHTVSQYHNIITISSQYHNIITISSQYHNITISHTPYSIQHTPYSIHHTAYTIQHTAYSIHHTAYTIQHTPYSIHHTAIHCFAPRQAPQ